MLQMRNLPSAFPVVFRQSVGRPFLINRLPSRLVKKFRLFPFLSTSSAGSECLIPLNIPPPVLGLRHKSKARFFMALQSRFVSVKCSLSCLSPVELSGWVLSQWPDASLVWALHNSEEGKHPHFHACIRFPSVRVWGSLRSWLSERDPHHYSEPGRSWRRAVRYLLHLDNPEKASIPWEALDSRNVDDSELAQLLGSPKQTIVEDILSCSGMSPGSMMGFLLSRGYAFHEISACIGAFLACSRFSDLSARLSLAPPAPDFSPEEFSAPFDNEFDF